MGRRILILHSYRDGRGAVCQHQPGHFTDLAGLETKLEELPRRFPDFKCDTNRLRARAQELLSVAKEPRATSTKQACKALQTLLKWLGEGRDVQDLGPELATLRVRLQEANPGFATL